MEPVDLGIVGRFRFNRTTVDTVESFLRNRGAEGLEGFALLGGYPLDKQEFVTDFAFIPEQTASGIHVSPAPDSLIAINEQLPEIGRMFAVQIHSHPGDAFHSDVDAADTTLVQEGSLSIVVPDFAHAGLTGWPGCAVYRRQNGGDFGRLSRREFTELLVIDDEEDRHA